MQTAQREALSGNGHTPGRDLSGETSSAVKQIGIAGRGDFLDDALAALFRERGYRVAPGSPHNGGPPVDLVIFRILGGGRDRERARLLTTSTAPVVVLGPRDPEVSNAMPSAAWLQYSSNTRTVLATVEKIIGAPSTMERLPAPQLSSREKDAVAAYARGMTVREVAAELGVAPTTVSTHLDRARAKYLAAGRAAEGKVGLLRCALEDGLIPCPCHNRW